MAVSSSMSNEVVLFHDFNAYVSTVVGTEVSTGTGVIELSEDFKKQLVIDLEVQKKKFAEEDRKLAEYIATLKKNENSKDSKTSASSASLKKNAVKNDEEEEEEEFDIELLELDPVNYRQHDLYKVLGLEKRRWLATPDEIKAAYRRRVVRHHPDKLKQNPRGIKIKNPNIEDDSFFKLIQKAWQVLTDPGRKADFDACDPTFDESIPEDFGDFSDEAEFYSTYGPVFERNARFSKKQPAPSLGNAETPRAEVEAFYSFWICVESWRRFEWLDEDEPAGADNRADKRWHEKKNKAKRDSRKKDDNSRLIRLAETAMKRDPRMIRWREADRAAKNAKKNSKADAAKALKEAELAKKAAEAAEKAAAEAAAKLAKESAAVNKAAAKAAIKSARKALRDAIGNTEEWAKDLVAEIRNVQALAHLIERVIAAVAEDTERLVRIADSINQIVANCGGRKGNLAELKTFLESAESNTESSVAATTTAAAETAVTEEIKTEVIEVKQDYVESKVSTTWSTEEVDYLIAAVKQYPGGSLNRWEQITSSLNRHISNSSTLSTKNVWSVDQVISRANELQKAKDQEESEQRAREEAQTAAALAASKKKRDPRVDQAAPTVATHYYANDEERSTATATHGSQPVSTSIQDQSDKENIWSPDDQLALESALKSVPADDANRWDRVADLVPGKNKKECMSRVKEIAAILKAKK